MTEVRAWLLWSPVTDVPGLLRRQAHPADPFPVRPHGGVMWPLAVSGPRARFEAGQLQPSVLPLGKHSERFPADVSGSPQPS